MKKKSDFNLCYVAAIFERNIKEGLLIEFNINANVKTITGLNYNFPIVFILIYIHKIALNYQGSH